MGREMRLPVTTERLLKGIVHLFLPMSWATSSNNETDSYIHCSVKRRHEQCQALAAVGAFRPGPPSSSETPSAVAAKRL